MTGILVPCFSVVMVTQWVSVLSLIFETGYYPMNQLFAQDYFLLNSTLNYRHAHGGTAHNAFNKELIKGRQYL